jgi:hypothetical protein
MCRRKGGRISDDKAEVTHLLNTAELETEVEGVLQAYRIIESSRESPFGGEEHDSYCRAERCDHFLFAISFSTSIKVYI